ncbi:MAG: EamA family transporter [Cytophagales bacterium]|nr:EamA family transporter [Cytophagales bacterium]
MPSWLILAILTAVFKSIMDIFSKFALRRTNEFVVGWAVFFFTTPFLIPIWIIIDIPPLGGSYWYALILSGTMNAIIMVIYMKALQSSDLSVTLPMLTFTPLFLLITSPLIVGEFPNRLGIVGIVLIVFGAYSLNINTLWNKSKKIRNPKSTAKTQRRKVFLEKSSFASLRLCGEIRNSKLTLSFLKNIRALWIPFRALFHEKGPRLMLLVAFLWSISSNLDKIGIQNSSPLFWAVSINLFIIIILTPVIIWRSKKEIARIFFGKWKMKDGKKEKTILSIFHQTSYIFCLLLGLGLFSALTFICHMTALSLTLVAYLVAIKRSSVILGVLGGYFIFKEKNISSRLVGAVIMVIGVFCIALS